MTTGISNLLTLVIQKYSIVKKIIHKYQKNKKKDFYEKNGNFKSLDQGRRGTLVGTINYLSPEMIKEQKAGPVTDMWAFGCILFKMLTGKVPFPGTQQPTVYQKIL